MAMLLRLALILFALICVTAEDKDKDNKGDIAAQQESPAEAKKFNKNKLAKILEDLQTLDHHDVKKLHRILMKGRVLRKLNKALRKEAETKMGNKNILTQLRAFDANKIGESHQLNIHQLKRFMKLGKSPALEKMERTNAEISLEKNPSGTKELSDEKKSVDDKAQEMPEP